MAKRPHISIEFSKLGFLVRATRKTSRKIDFSKRISNAMKKEMKKTRRYAISEYLSGPYPSKIQSRSGALAKGIEHGVDKQSGDIHGFLKSTSPYGRIHEFGGVIKAQNKPWMTFFIDEVHGGPQWVKVKQVTMPARPYLYPAVGDRIKEIRNAIGLAAMQPLINMQRRRR